MSPTPKLQVHISDYDLESALENAIRSHISTALGAKLAERIEREVEEQVTSAVVTFVETFTTERLTAEVDRLLTEGWARTNEWGEKKGDVINLASTVRERLAEMTKEHPTAYSRDDRPSLIQKIVTSKAEEAVKQGLQPLIDEAKSKLRTELDLSIGKSLRLTLADAIRG